MRARRADAGAGPGSAHSLADRASILVALGALFRLELNGQLPNSRSRNAIRVLGLALRSLDHPNQPPTVLESVTTGDQT